MYITLNVFCGVLIAELAVMANLFVGLPVPYAMTHVLHSSSHGSSQAWDLGSTVVTPDK
jgi:hypothetical protein